MMKWAHLSDFQVNGIAAAQLTLTSGVAAVVMTAVAYGLALKGRELYRKHHKVSWPVSGHFIECAMVLLWQRTTSSMWWPV